MKKRIKNSSSGIAIKKNKSMSKLSQGHVEFMISFVLFITSILLLFVFINPIGKSESKTKLQENAKDLIIENITANVGTLDIFTYQGKNCYNVSKETYGDNFYETYVDEQTGPPGQRDRNYRIYFSPYLMKNDTNSVNHGCNLDKYSIGAYSKEELIMKNKTIELKKNYEQNYKETKRSLGISNDFTFSFRYTNGSIVPEMSVDKNVSSNVEKFSTEYPVRVMDDHANVFEMIINIKLW